MNAASAFEYMVRSSGDSRLTMLLLKKYGFGQSGDGLYEQLVEAEEALARIGTQLSTAQLQVSELTTRLGRAQQDEAYARSMYENAVQQANQYNQLYIQLQNDTSAMVAQYSETVAALDALTTQYDQLSDNYATLQGVHILDTENYSNALVACINALNTVATGAGAPTFTYNGSTLGVAAFASSCAVANATRTAEYSAAVTTCRDSINNVAKDCGLSEIPMSASLQAVATGATAFETGYLALTGQSSLNSVNNSAKMFARLRAADTIWYMNKDGSTTAHTFNAAVMADGAATAAGHIRTLSTSYDSGYTAAGPLHQRLPSLVPSVTAAVAAAPEAAIDGDRVFAMSSMPLIKLKSGLSAVYQSNVNGGTGTSAAPTAITVTDAVLDSSGRTIKATDPTYVGWIQRLRAAYETYVSQFPEGQVTSLGNRTTRWYGTLVPVVPGMTVLDSSGAIVAEFSAPIGWITEDAAIPGGFCINQRYRLDSAEGAPGTTTASGAGSSQIDVFGFPNLYQFAFSVPRPTTVSYGCGPSRSPVVFPAVGNAPLVTVANKWLRAIYTPFSVLSGVDAWRKVAEFKSAAWPNYALYT